MKNVKTIEGLMKYMKGFCTVFEVIELNLWVKDHVNEHLYF